MLREETFTLLFYQLTAREAKASKVLDRRFKTSLKIDSTSCERTIET